MEMIKCPNDTIMIGILLIVFLVFKKYNIPFSLLYVVHIHIWSHFSLKISISKYQRNIYMQELF
jgi:ABC-type transport system involved in Fe-S cluster assembly fused permease/ATPase subunit